MDVALYKILRGVNACVSGGEQVEALVYICFRPPPPSALTGGHANLSAAVLHGSPRARSRPRVGGLVAGRSPTRYITSGPRGSSVSRVRHYIQ